MSRPYFAPHLDLLNFGEMGVRIEFDDARHELRATAGAPIAQGRELLFDCGATCKESRGDTVPRFRFRGFRVSR